MDVIATAGHVDHGKSALVRALTGMEPDRWAEERRRGLTIDLGFAWTTLPSGRRLAVVDVPGHERFIGNMLAGVGSVPAALLVVAADDGWSAQTAEHVAALDALGVRHALLVVTKADVADPAPVLADVRERLGGTSMGEVPGLAVSALTGEGMPGLVAALEALLADLPAPDPGAPVRLWIDRAFTIRGAGTVVTGTLAAGTVADGDRLRLGDREVAVRGVQTLGEPVPEATATARVALNLRGIAVEELSRGDALLTPGAFRSTALLDVTLRGAPEGRLPDEAMVHIGSATVAARLRPLDGAAVRLRLAGPLPLRVGDRLLVRDPGARRVFGADVRDVDPPELRRRGAARSRADRARPATDRHRRCSRRSRAPPDRAGRRLHGDGLADAARGHPVRPVAAGARTRRGARQPHSGGRDPVPPAAPARAGPADRGGAAGAGAAGRRSGPAPAPRAADRSATGAWWKPSWRCPTRCSRPSTASAPAWRASRSPRPRPAISRAPGSVCGSSRRPCAAGSWCGSPTASTWRRGWPSRRAPAWPGSPRRSRSARRGRRGGRPGGSPSPSWSGWTARGSPQRLPDNTRRLR